MNSKRSFALAAMLIGFADVANAAPRPKEKQNGFMGHYGYLISYPVGYAPNPSFSGPIEVVQFMPAAACGADQTACAKAGWINLSVFPKRVIKEANGIGSFTGYMDAVLADSKANGEDPKSKRAKIGTFPGDVIAIGKPKGPFNRMAYIEGSKVYYRFSYDASNADAVKIMKSLAETRPHDDPPGGAGR